MSETRTNEVPVVTTDPITGAPDLSSEGNPFNETESNTLGGSVNTAALVTAGNFIVAVLNSYRNS